MWNNLQNHREWGGPNDSVLVLNTASPQVIEPFSFVMLRSKHKEKMTDAAEIRLHLRSQPGSNLPRVGNRFPLGAFTSHPGKKSIPDPCAQSTTQ